MVPVRETREAAYRLLLDLLAAAGAADLVEGGIDLSPGTCGGGVHARHRVEDGYHTLGVLANIRLRPGRRHETFIRLREFALSRGGDVAVQRNPPDDASGERRIAASAPGDHGQRFGFAVFVAEPPDWALVAVGPNGCRRHPGPPEDLGPFTLAGLVPALPPDAPVRTPGAGPPQASRPPAPPPPTRSPSALGHITDALG